MNTAIDMVCKMFGSIDNSVKDATKCKITFCKHILENDEETINRTPLMRMQHTLAKHKAMEEEEKRLAKEYDVVLLPRMYPNFHKEGCDLDYFGADIEQQKLIEQSFVAAVLDADLPSEHSAFRPLCVDSISKVVQFLKTCPLPPQRRHEFVMFDVAIAFALRLNLLAMMVLRDHRSVACNALLKTVSASATQSSKWRKFKHTVALEGRTKDISLDLDKYLAFLTQDQNRKAEVLSNKLRPLTKLNPLFCCLNDTQIRMHTAIQSVTIMDLSRVIQILGHVWNLLREKRHLGKDWPDLDFLTSALGVPFVFQGERPTIEGGSEALAFRIWYASGFKKKDVGKAFLHLYDKKRVSSHSHHKFRLTRRFIASDMPLFWIHDCREGWDMCAYEVGAVDVVLIAAAVIIPPMLGQ